MCWMSSVFFLNNDYFLSISSFKKLQTILKLKINVITCENVLYVEDMVNYKQAQGS